MRQSESSSDKIGKINAGGSASVRDTITQIEPGHGARNEVEIRQGHVDQVEHKLRHSHKHLNDQEIESVAVVWHS